MMKRGIAVTELTFHKCLLFILIHFSLLLPQPATAAGNEHGFRTRKHLPAMDSTQTLLLRKNTPTVAPGNYHVTLVDLVVKRLPPDRRDALKAYLELRLGDSLWNSSLMVRDGWVRQERLELRLMDGQPEKGSATVEARIVRPLLYKIPVSGTTLYLAKIGDPEHSPNSQAYGKPEYESHRINDDGLPILLYLLIPSRLRDAEISYRENSTSRNLPAKKSIFRNPDSPTYTFLIFDPVLPGILHVKTPKGDTVNYALADLAKALESSPIHLNPEIPDGFPVSELPEGFR
jgi:hypothetical protein